MLAAMRLEIEYFRKMKVYTKVHRREAYGVTGKPPIKVRWVDVNKGSKEVPEIRSRLVAKEIKVNDRPDLFAGTPPLEALKLLLSMAASSGEEDVCIMHTDASRAYFHAPSIRPVYVDIVNEDWVPGDDEMCGKLNVSMCGTRDAASNWEAAYGGQLRIMGFRQGRSSSCLFRHDSRNIATLVHGDDFISVGKHDDLAWMQKELGGQFMLKTKNHGRGGKAREEYESAKPKNWLGATRDQL